LLGLDMTPQEFAVLFSGHVTAFFLIWFTNIAERVVADTGKPPERERAEHDPPLDSVARGNAWNVGMFFVIKRSTE
jgi:hypothetical protein